MNKIKSFIKIFGILFLVLFLLKNIIYRSTVTYHYLGERGTIAIHNPTLIDKIESKSINKNLEIEDIIQIANAVTSDELSFTFNYASNNPNILLETQKANCIGYSAMFHSIATYLIIKNGLTDKFESKHVVGKLDLLGIDLHQFFHTSFFIDHDFNIIKDLDTGTSISIDPSIHDYLGVSKVSSNYD